MLNAIEIKGLVKAYPGFRLDGLDLTLPSGSIMGLVGENGAGKSTTIKLIMNAARRDGGTVSVLGTDNRSAAFNEVKEDIGVVLDEAYFPEVLNAGDVGAESDPYGVRVLVRRDMVPHDLPLEHTNLEDIILFLAKGGTRR